MNEEKENVTYTLNKDTKDKAYAVLDQLGIDPDNAVRAFLGHIAMFGEFPFQPTLSEKEIHKIQSYAFRRNP